MIEHIDSLNARVLSAALAAGRPWEAALGESLVVVTSDHGTMLGDNGRDSKMTPWNQVLRVPLIVAGWGVDADAIVRAPVATLDVSATLVDVAGAAWRSDAVSLRSLLYARPAAAGAYGSKFVLSGLAAGRADFRVVISAVDGGVFKLVCC
mmetsp:Transcript_3623/g.12808  ORF Transcript_3623/g.12808 Transcript_3623/m.12808 type:complete len:151 (+) Transcript_3623:836-1288(+)